MERAIPKQFQKDGVYDIEDFGGRALLADEMGLGKTLMPLWALQRNPTWGPALIICPAHLKFQWRTEAQVHTGHRFDIAESQTPPGHSLHSADGLIINYDILRHWLPYIERYVRPRLIVVDECQHTMNPGTKRTKAVQEVCRGVPHVIGGSGTPLMNRPIEIWPILNIIRPDKFPSRWTFGERYCNPRLRRGWKDKWEFKGATRLDELNMLLRQTCMIRRRKQDVLGELSDKVRQVIPMELSDPGEYEFATQNFLTWLKINHAHRALKASHAERLTQIGYMLRLVARLKCRAVVNWVNYFQNSTGEKLVLFAKHAAMIGVLERRCEAKSVTIDGAASATQRKTRVDQFTNDPTCRLLIGSEAAITGLNLQRVCNNVAFAELFWRPADHTQAEDRIHRIGQDLVAYIWYLIAPYTIEDKLCELIQKKQTVISATLDGGGRDDDLNIFDQLLLEMGRMGG